MPITAHPLLPLLRCCSFGEGPFCPVWGPPRRLKNIGLNTYAEDRKGQLKRSLHASVSHAQEHRATLLRRAARARRAMGETSYTRGAGGARESVGSAEARVRPSPRPSSALAARARATGNIGFIVRKGRPGKKYSRSTTRNLSCQGAIRLYVRANSLRAMQG